MPGSVQSGNPQLGSLQSRLADFGSGDPRTRLRTYSPAASGSPQPGATNFGSDLRHMHWTGDLQPFERIAARNVKMSAFSCPKSFSAGVRMMKLGAVASHFYFPGKIGQTIGARDLCSIAAFEALIEIWSSSITFHCEVDFSFYNSFYKNFFPTLLDSFWGGLRGGIIARTFVGQLSARLKTW